MTEHQITEERNPSTTSVRKYDLREMLYLIYITVELHVCDSIAVGAEHLGCSGQVDFGEKGRMLADAEQYPSDECQHHCTCW